MEEYNFLADDLRIIIDLIVDWNISKAQLIRYLKMIAEDIE